MKHWKNKRIFSSLWPFAFIFTGLLISCVPASSENSFAHFLHFQYASCPVSVQPASFFSTFSSLWPFAFISTGLLISCVPASSENSFASDDGDCGHECSFACGHGV